MRRLETLDALRAWRIECAPRQLGLVPTMGGLHDAHLSLASRSIDECDRTIASIFVNPAQFGESSDLENYPRDLKRDCELLEQAGCDAVYCPSVEAIYPAGFETWVEPGAIAEPLEGAGRPGHFRGVATVVLKLLNQVRPHRAYFGRKDAQQLAVIRALVRDLDLEVLIVGCPIVREADGLAISTRNQRLSSEERKAAAVLYRALTAARHAHRLGERNPERLRQAMRKELARESLAAVEYASAADPETLRELEAGDSTETALLSLAVRFNEIRLIDNQLL